MALLALWVTGLLAYQLPGPGWLVTGVAGLWLLVAAKQMNNFRLMSLLKPLLTETQAVHLGQPLRRSNAEPTHACWLKKLCANFANASCR